MSVENAESARRVANLIEWGEVIEVNASDGTARVKIGDLETDFIPWMTERAGSDHSWWPLENGEWVIVAAPGGDIARAVVLGSVPTGRFPPHGQAGVWRHSFEDGSFIEYSGGDITIKATGNVKIEAARIDLN